MGRTILGLGALAAAALWGANVSAAECAPPQMAKVVFSNVTPGIDPASFAARPKTMYRHTERYGRVEEEPNPATGAHLLVVVNEPDVWFVNLADRTGRHAVDPGPEFEFRAPIFSGADLPAVLGKLETGCELDFVAQYAPRPVERVTLDGQALDKHQVSVGIDRIEVLVAPNARRVVSVGRYRNDRPVMVLRYLDYAVDLPPDLSLFAKPEGIAFRSAAEAGRQP
ncbi:MAG: hypothetical protein ACK41C_13410 [Phenylobacterium sp.]|uniref:hypothetical protein n=1 Tax=Phenylobacterium sp. TaxID=1871053 RepID=UPI003918987B